MIHYIFFYVCFLALSFPDILLSVDEIYTFFINSKTIQADNQLFIISLVIWLTRIYILIVRLLVHYKLVILTNTVTVEEKRNSLEYYIKFVIPFVILNIICGVIIYFKLISSTELKHLYSEPNRIFLYIFSVLINCMEFFIYIRSYLIIKNVSIIPFDSIVELQRFSEIQNCSICLEDFEEGIQLNCKHSFHKDCINTWFKSKINCPLCRNDLTTIRIN